MCHDQPWKQHHQVDLIQEYNDGEEYIYIFTDFKFFKKSY